jgi:hypothetical protein
VGAARCGGASPASSAPAPRGRPRPKHLAQMNGRVVVRLTELGIGRGGGARWSGRRRRGGAGVDRRHFSTKIHVRSGAEGGEEGLGDDPGPMVMLPSDLSGTPVRRSCVAAAAGSLCYGGARQGRWDSGSGGAGVDGVQGGVAGATYRAAAALACVPGMEGRRNSRQGSRLCRCASAARGRRS